MKRRGLEKWWGVALVIAIGLVHLVEVPEHLVDVPYLGVLFLLNFLGSLVAAIGIWRRQRWGWLLGLLLASGSIVGYILSRSTGMPGHPVEPWTDPLGLVSLEIEIIFVLGVLALWPRLVGQATADVANWWEKYRFLPSATVSGVIVFGLVLGFLLTRTELITQQTLEDEFGLRVTQVATTMLGGVLDVRMIVTDVEKAEAIFNDHDKMPYMRVVDSDSLILPPLHEGHRVNLLEGKTYYMLFPNPGLAVIPGSEVSMVFGNKQIPSMTVK